MGIKGNKWKTLTAERELNPKIKEKAGKVADTVKGIDASKVLTMVVGGVTVEVAKGIIKKD